MVDGEVLITQTNGQVGSIVIVGYSGNVRVGGKVGTVMFCKFGKVTSGKIKFGNVKLGKVKFGKVGAVEFRKAGKVKFGKAGKVMFGKSGNVTFGKFGMVQFEIKVEMPKQ